MHRLCSAVMMLLACGPSSSSEPVNASQAELPPAPPAPPPAAPEPETEPEEVVVPPESVVASPIDATWKTYRDKKSGVSFRYPKDYLLKPTRDVDGIHLVLMEDDKLSRDYLSGKLDGQPMDGPMQISVWLQPMTLEGETLEAFTQRQLGEYFAQSAMVSRELNGAHAVAYQTDGLWAGFSVTIQHPKLLIHAHVDHNGPDTRIRRDFEAMATTFAW